MGDCGAFGYVDEKEPPYSVNEVLDYYTRHGFNYGISVDHLVLGADNQDERQYRYDLTLENAQEFYDSHQSQELGWTPMAAVQGWDVESYVEAAERCVEIGYDFLAIGGLVRSSTEEILLVLRKIREAVGPTVDLHALGVARFGTIDDFVEIGVTSMDSATYLRRAWTSRKDNFWTRDELVFSAIRVPGPKRSLRTSARKAAKKGAKQEIETEEMKNGKSLTEEEKENRISEAVDGAVSEALSEKLESARAMERRCFDKLRAYGSKASDALSVPELVDLLDQYQDYVGRDCLREHYAAMLEARPWDACNCAICERADIEIAIFRGNNRNRRRGFHNTRVFYDLLGETLKNKKEIRIQRGADAIEVGDEGERASGKNIQYQMFG
jgi:hypothetical protein